MKIHHINERYFGPDPQKKTAKDFEHIYGGGTCGARYDCGKPGVILAYDDFNPETATWFCSDCWDDLGIAEPMFTIVEDKRTNAGGAK